MKTSITRIRFILSSILVCSTENIIQRFHGGFLYLKSDVSYLKKLLDNSVCDIDSSLESLMKSYVEIRFGKHLVTASAPASKGTYGCVSVKGGLNVLQKCFFVKVEAFWRRFHAEHNFFHRCVLVKEFVNLHKQVYHVRQHSLFLLVDTRIREWLVHLKPSPEHVANTLEILALFRMYYDEFLQRILNHSQEMFYGNLLIHGPFVILC